MLQIELYSCEHVGRRPHFVKGQFIFMDFTLFITKNVRKYGNYWKVFIILYELLQENFLTKFTYLKRKGIGEGKFWRV